MKFTATQNRKKNRFYQLAAITSCATLLLIGCGTNESSSKSDDPPPVIQEATPINQPSPESPAPSPVLTSKSSEVQNKEVEVFISLNRFDFEENSSSARRSRIISNSLEEGQQVIIEVKNASGELAGCLPQESKCLNGIRTYQTVDLQENTFSFPAIIGKSSSLSLKIMNSQQTLYHTQEDILLKSNNELIQITINLYPTGIASMNLGSLEKTIAFQVPVSDITHQLLTGSAIKAELTCALPSGKAIAGLPIAVPFEYNAVKKLLFSSDLSLNLYVGSPCKLNISNDNIAGSTTFQITSDLNQKIDGINFAHQEQFILGGITVKNQGGKMEVQLETSIATQLDTFLNGLSTNLSYRIEIKGKWYHQKTDLTQKENLFLGLISPYPPSEIPLDVTLIVTKNNELWLSSTQSISFDVGTQTLAPFVLKFEKIAVANTSFVRGNLLLQVQEKNKKYLDDVMVTLKKQDGFSLECTTNKGLLQLIGQGKNGCQEGLPVGKYEILFEKKGFESQKIEVEIKENALLQKLVTL